MENIQQIINNRSIEVTPKNIFKLIILFGILLFIAGFFLGYVITSHFIYESMYNLINNNGLLIFDDKYYRFIEVLPNLEFTTFNEILN